MGYTNPYETEQFFEAFMKSFSSPQTVLTNSYQFIIGIVVFIFQGIALYTIAKRRGYDKPWMSWIPIVNIYLLGKIADDINRYRNKKTRYGVLLLCGTIATQIIAFAMIVFIVTFLFRLDYSGMSNDNAENLLIFVFAIFAFIFAILIVAIIFSVFQFIALYRIFYDYDQQNATLFIILSIFLGGFGLHAIFLFVIRNKPSASIYYTQQYQQYVQQQQVYQNQQYQNQQYMQNQQVYQNPQSNDPNSNANQNSQ